MSAPGTPAHRPGFWPCIALLVGVISVSTGAIFARRAQVEAGSLAISAWRVSLAFLVLLPWALRTECPRIRVLSGRQWGIAMSLFQHPAHKYPPNVPQG